MIKPLTIMGYILIVFWTLQIVFHIHEKSDLAIVDAIMLMLAVYVAKDN